MHLQHDCEVGGAEFPRHAPYSPKPAHNLHTIGSRRARGRRKPAPPQAKTVTAQRVFGSIRTGCAIFTRPLRLHGISQAQRATLRAPHRMASDKELADFLAGIERRAFKQAVYAVRDDEAALDIVQDAMIRLAEKYGDKPSADLPLLFTRILQNAIHDYFRRQKVRNTWVTLFSNLAGPGDDERDDFDPLETLLAEDGSVQTESSEDAVSRAEILSLIEAEIQKLPTRQREAFLMRYWEDMDVAETAATMGCSEGSVKTHCSRATHALAQALKAKGIRL